MDGSVKVGIIGGTGLEDPALFEGGTTTQKAVDTPFGPPSDVLTLGKIAGVAVVIIPRHNRQHGTTPTHVNYRANIYALKQEGCTHVLSATACGSLRENMRPLDFVVLDQFIDRTTKRHSTFYDSGDGCCHIAMAEPFCSTLRDQTISTLQELGIPHHPTGTVVTVEGPRFSTKAESRLFRSWECDVINMTTVPEVVLAREAGMCYMSVAMVTDYDSWREAEESVTVEVVVRTLKANAENAKRLFTTLVPRITNRPCMCREAAQSAFIGNVTPLS